MNIKNEGLTSIQAEKRLEENGENVLLSGKKTSIAGMFFSQFKDLMILILAIATVISVAMGEGTEAIAIIIIVLLNAIMGFVQEYRTEKTLAALNALSAPHTHVLRDGKLCEIEAKNLVTDDVFFVSAGDRFPADGRVIEACELLCDEAIITGESEPVNKSVGGLIYMGSVAVSGNAYVLTTATAMNTEMGKIAGMLSSAETAKTPLQQRLAELGRFVAVACVIVCLCVGFMGFLQGENFLQMLLTGVSLAVAAIPEGLPAIVTIVLALSVGRILKKGAIIRKLPAVETLGCAGVICSDKTGTITQSKMSVEALWVNGEGQINLYENESIPQLNSQTKSILSRFWRGVCVCSATPVCPDPLVANCGSNPTETALLEAGAKNGFDKNTIIKDYTVLHEVPFNSVTKEMSVTAKYKGEIITYTKGAPDILLKKCKYMATSNAYRVLTQTDRENIMMALRSMATNALRIIAVAESLPLTKKGDNLFKSDGNIKDSDKLKTGGTLKNADVLQNVVSTRDANSPQNELVFLGLAGLCDPPRPEVAPAVRECRRAGIKPVMITGDFAETATAIAKKVGIFKHGDNVFEGEKIDKMTDSELTAVCMKTSVFARVTPAHKLRIVKAYQARGMVVAMTGDGVNDAPAVKQADIGVAMNCGTDVTKEAASVVILDNNFATIVSAVEEGRIIYQNIRRFIRYLLTGNLGEVLSMLFAMLLGLPVALVPIQILMMNLLTDGLPAIALGMDPPSRDMMSHKPRPKNEGLFAHGLMRTIILRGILLGIATAGAYWAVYNMCGDLTIARSSAYLTIVLSQMVHIFECRDNTFDLKGNPFLIFAAATSAVLCIVTVYFPFLQGVFSTAPVFGINLLPVLVGTFLSPVVMFILRKIYKLFK